MTRSYRRIVAQYQRDYPHQIRLQYPGEWRARHIDHALRELLRVAWGRDYAQWYEGKDPDRVTVWGFRSIEHRNDFYDWTLASGIDWRVPPNEQEHRPAPVPEFYRFAGPND